MITKTKKIVAAAAAALAIGAMGTTAFAYTARDGFTISFKAGEENVFVGPAKKTDTYYDAAVVTVSNGVSRLVPVEFAVWDSSDELYGRRLTDEVIVNTLDITNQIPYLDKTGAPTTNDFFFLHLFAGVDKTVKGNWAP